MRVIRGGSGRHGSKALTITVAMLVLLCTVRLAARAQAAAQSLADTWQGTLHAGKDLRLVFKIAKADTGYKTTAYSIDQGGQPLPIATTTLVGSAVTMDIPAIGGKYEGKLSVDGKTISGTFTQGANPLPLDLARATPETAWVIPEPPPKLAAMTAANPSFEVATIKPTKPDEKGKMVTVRGREFRTVNISFSELVSFAYGLHPKQLVGGPAWTEADHYDITAVPDAEGQPNDKQLKVMIQKLLTDRFKFTYHKEKKELSVFVLSAAKTGPKLTKSEGDPNGLPGLFFSALGDLHVRNATMVDLCQLLQQAVLDRPVVDQSGVTGRYDFNLKWTPDDSQFSGMGAKIPPTTDAANAPPNLFTAIQDQIGLKLDATRAPTEVFAIDHVEKPSAN